MRVWLRPTRCRSGVRADDTTVPGEAYDVSHAADSAETTRDPVESPVPVIDPGDPILPRSAFLPLHGRASEHALVSGAGSLLHLEHRTDAPFGLDPELQVQPALLEDLDAVADPVVLPVLGRPHTDTRRADEPRTERKAVPDFDSGPF